MKSGIRTPICMPSPLGSAASSVKTLTHASHPGGSGLATWQVAHILAHSEHWLSTRLNLSGCSGQIVTYPGAGSGFTLNQRISFQPEPTRRRLRAAVPILTASDTHTAC